ncbi:hypothetical protein [Treponema sp. R80B11-R83G3]
MAFAEWPRFKNGSGIRFKLIGDGKSWFLQLSVKATNTGYAFYDATIKTKKKLDAFEQSIEDNAEKFVPLSDKEKTEVETIINAAYI